MDRFQNSRFAPANPSTSSPSSNVPQQDASDQEFKDQEIEQSSRLQRSNPAARPAPPPYSLTSSAPENEQNILSRVKDSLTRKMLSIISSETERLGFQPGPQLWTSDSTDVALQNIQDFFGIHRQVPSMTFPLPPNSPNLTTLAKHEGFIAQILQGLAQQMGCVARFIDSTTTSEVDNLQFASSLAPAVGMSDSKNVMQLILGQPPEPWSGYTVEQIFAHDESREVFVEGLRRRIAAAMDLPRLDVRVLDVEQGSVKITFICYWRKCASAPNHLILPADIEQAFREQFPTTFQALLVHPMYFVLGFNMSSIETTASLACRSFDGPGQTFQVGPEGQQRPYHQPTGWTRIGLKVLGKFGGEEGDSWLHPFLDVRNWYRCYHGAKREAFRPVVEEGFIPSDGGKLGPGVYVSPHVDYAARFGAQVEVEMIDGQKRSFQCVFMCAVRPGSVAGEGFPRPAGHPGAGENAEWVVRYASDIRPYGILIREGPAAAAAAPESR